jgi:Tfp pilus assembly protein PilV
MRRAWGQRGVSLVEALVAMVILSFGTVAVLGVQTSLRYNADVAKQRSEAVRIAQEQIELVRGFGTLADYDALDSVGATEVVGYTTNTTFSLVQTVSTSNDPRVKTVVVDVVWEDRSGGAQAVRLTTSVLGVEPQLAGSLAVSSDTAYVQTPGRRNSAIPRGAEWQSDGTSRFFPPGSGTVSWIFNNNTGEIRQICNGGVCTDVNARLLAGFVVFATGTTQPTGADAEVPPSPKPSGYTLQVQVLQTAPSVVTVQCFEDQSLSAYVEYFCALDVGTPGTAWSGRSELTGLPLASSVATVSSATYRVCRYTTLRSDAVVSASTLGNEDHPRDYLNLSFSLGQQNFLVILGGDDSSAFDCPDDDSSTPFVFGRTWRHQPNS